MNLKLVSVHRGLLHPCVPKDSEDHSDCFFNYIFCCWLQGTFRGSITHRLLPQRRCALHRYKQKKPFYFTFFVFVFRFCISQKFRTKKKSRKMANKGKYCLSTDQWKYLIPWLVGSKSCVRSKRKRNSGAHPRCVCATTTVFKERKKKTSPQ